MSTRGEKAVELFAKGYNCAQSVAGVFCDSNSKPDKQTMFKLCNGLGGGVRHGELCGAISGAVLVIGMNCGFYKENDFDQKNYCNEKTIELIEKCKEQLGALTCRELLGVDIRCPLDHKSSEAREAYKIKCADFVKKAVEILENIEFETKSST